YAPHRLLLRDARGDSGLHERADDRASEIGLWVPLHAEHEATVGQLDRLGQLVQRGDATHEQPVPQPLYGLVVVRLGLMHELPSRARGERTLVQNHVVLGTVEGAWDASVLLVAEVLGQVLNERATAGHVDE